MPNEAQTRKELIDPQLEKAGWDVGNRAQTVQCYEHFPLYDYLQQS